ncbi:MAG: hypothetical protein J6113_09565 [Lachnospiraceae bacterium]|nr:hypothetical protein [Lachnospiraceae bacterium]
MYPCSNCGAGLRFDIPTQKLKCDYCDSEFDPYTIKRDKDAVEHDTFETTVYTCPQCGGEIISDDETAATFCSYCGNTTVLDSRISNEKRPEFIITFKKSKEECKQAFSKAVKKAIFAPKEYKDPELIEKFRGIYMPYWAYDFETDSVVSFEGSTSHRSGDYIIEDFYRISGPIHGEAEGITYDATSTFSDDISASISPYNIKQKQAFTPSLLSGFYADTNDVDKAIYSDDATEMVSRYNQTQVLGSKAARSKSISSKEKNKVKQDSAPGIKGAGLAFLPVWFLSYKTPDKRMAYAVINGQTGKASVDIPVDKRKFLLFGGIIAAVIFVILSLVFDVVTDFTFTPQNLLAITLVLSIIMFFMSSSQLSAIRKRETLEDDQGMLYRRKLEEMKAAERNEISAEQLENATEQQKDDYIRSDSLALRCATAVNNNTAQKAKKVGCLTVFGLIVLSVILLFVVGFYIPVLLDMYVILANPALSEIVSVLGILTSAVLIFFLWRNGLSTGNPFKSPGKAELSSSAKLLKIFVSMLLAVAILLLRPVQDMYYYGAAIICIAILIITEFEIIDQHNKLTTRKPPQLGRRGGDENA